MSGAAVVAALALSASPARVQLRGSGSAQVQVTNHGIGTAVVDVTRAGFALDLSGRPRIVTAARPAWLSFRPRRVAIPPGSTASLTVTARVPRGGRPGDHSALILLTSSAPARGAVTMRMRLGVVVVLRAPGRILHRLAVGRPQLRRHLLWLRIRNLGNVVELVDGQRLQVSLRQARRSIRLHAAPRQILPGGRAAIALQVPRLAHRLVSVEVRLGSRVRRYRIRLRTW